jgi:hypothetical protein
MAPLSLAESPCAFASDTEALSSAVWLDRPVGYTSDDEADYLSGRTITPAEYRARRWAEDAEADAARTPAEEHDPEGRPFV